MSLWDIGNALDGAMTGLNQIENLLQIYDECIEADLRVVQKNAEDGYARYFVDRYDILRSLLEMIQIHTHNTAASLQEQVNAINAAIREERQIAT